MPELHSLTPMLSNLQDQGFAVALVTDGRMSGASGKVPAAIHVCPEAVNDGPIGRIKDGDIITIDAGAGVLSVNADLTERTGNVFFSSAQQIGFGRQLFASMRAQAHSSEAGGGINTIKGLL